MPKLNGVNILRRSNSPANENFFQQHPSSRSSSPKSFSDHGFGSECASHLSSSRFLSLILNFILFILNKDSPNVINGCYTYKRKRLYAAAPGRKCMCIKSYRANSSGELSMNKGDIVESKIQIIYK
jgi:hypothetical protein